MAPGSLASVLALQRRAKYQRRRPFYRKFIAGESLLFSTRRSTIFRICIIGLVLLALRILLSRPRTTSVPDHPFVRYPDPLPSLPRVEVTFKSGRRQSLDLAHRGSRNWSFGSDEGEVTSSVVPLGVNITLLDGEGRTLGSRTTEDGPSCPAGDPGRWAEQISAIFDLQMGFKQILASGLSLCYFTSLGISSDSSA